MHHFREIECPNCQHQFVLMEHTYNGSIYKIYRRKGYNEELESTTCPKCNTEMVVLKDLHAGIDINDDSIEVASVLRGI